MRHFYDCCQITHTTHLLEAWIKAHKRELIIVGAMTAAGAIAAPIFIPLILNAVGFSSGGVVAGTLAASWQAAIGNVVAGSLFAMLQSMAATGAISLVGVLASAGLGMAGGLVVVSVKKLGEGVFTNCLQHINHVARMHHKTVAATMSLPYSGIRGN
jgi:hypothetical protein